MAEGPDRGRAVGAAPSYAQVVSSWAAHLASGGTTDWPTWRGGPGRSAAGEVLHPLPDAIHLALLRRLSRAWRDPVPGLAERVLATSSPGRGPVDVPLPFPAEPRRFGTPAVDPDRVPAEEVLRLAVGVLAHLLPEVSTDSQQRDLTPWPAPWRPRFRLYGAPVTAAAVRASLVAQRRVESDWRPTHVVVARPVEVMMAEQWAASVRAGGILKWSTLWRRARAAGRLPPAIDVAAIATRLEGGGPVHVVVARDPRRVATLAAEVLSARPGAMAPDVDTSECDLLRRLNRLTALTAGPDRVQHLARTLLDVVLARAHGDFVLGDVLDVDLEAATPAAPPAVPAAALPWARQVAAEVAADLRRAGYAVHGDPDDLAPSDTPAGPVDRERTLALAVTAIRRTWLLGGTP